MPVRGYTQQVETYVADVSDREAVYACGDLVKERFGQVDILVRCCAHHGDQRLHNSMLTRHNFLTHEWSQINNAGIVHGKKFLDVPDAAAEKVMQVNAIGTLKPAHVPVNTLSPCNPLSLPQLTFGLSRPSCQAVCSSLHLLHPPPLSHTHLSPAHTQ